jgi:hypothetical protein
MRDRLPISAIASTGAVAGQRDREHRRPPWSASSMFITGR